jgi:hypothetical protein
MAWIDTFQGGSTGRYSYPNNSNNSFWTPKYQKNFEDERARYITDRRNKNIESATNREYAERAFPANIELDTGRDEFIDGKYLKFGPSTVDRKNWSLPEIPSSEDTKSYSQQQLMDLSDSIRQNSYFGPNAFNRRHPNFYDKGPSTESGGLWPALKKYAGKQGISDWFDVGKTMYDIYNNETVAKPMLREQQRRAADIWNTQKPMMEYNLASAKRNEGRADAYKVDLWNALSRKEGEAERTYASGSPQVSYV